MGKIERGEHVPTLPLILKIARALKCSSAHLMTLTEAKLAESAPIRGLKPACAAAARLPLIVVVLAPKG
ncbi:XRE family transcriptional regulator [Pseudomonas aeruginosa]|nr:XRE family transcriptional regulator [Pseudomonas aeruginosa]